MTTLLDATLSFQEHAFENALPVPPVIDATKGKKVNLQVRETSQFLGLYDDEGNLLLTTVWGYGQGSNTSYPGPTILAKQGVPITINWQNKLPVDAHLLPVDTTIHIAHSDKKTLSQGFVPIVTHLHGGHNDAQFDGTPEQWFTQSGKGGPRAVGPDYVSNRMTYHNDQDATTLWYHDHALGITRLNVYAGLAGFYILQDDTRMNLVDNGTIPSASNDFGLAIQDRAFTEDGQLLLPGRPDDPIPFTDQTVRDVIPQEFYDKNGEHAVSILPEFFGDHILVNGMAWPQHTVAAGEYTFRLLNGSDSRFYVLRVSDPDVAVTMIGTDGGLLPQAATISDGDGIDEEGEFLVLAPGDRAELVFDFSELENGDTVELLNSGPLFEPFRGVDAEGKLLPLPLLGEVAPEAAKPSDPVGNIMQFLVDTSLPAPRDVSVEGGATLVPNFKYITDDPVDNTRQLGLFEGTDEFGRIKPMLGTAEPEQFGPLAFSDPATERPLLDTMEQWDVFNFTADSHPIHLHLTQFQVAERRAIYFQEGDGGLPDDINGGGITYGQLAPGADPDFTLHDIWIDDEAIALRPEETGWQDTIHVNPREMVAVVAEFDKPGEYVWHCHILSHEDNEMMRPFIVVTDPGQFA